MKLEFNNDSTYYLPIIDTSIYLNYSFILYWLLRLFEIFLLILSIFLTYIICRICIRYRTFHANFTLLLVFYLGQYFEFIIARILIIPYQEGWISIESFPSNMESQMDMLPLFLAGFMKTHYIVSLFVSIPMFLLERAVATIMISDYEQGSRVIIASFLLIVSHVFSIFLSCRLISGSFTKLEVLGFFSLFLLITLLIFTILYKYNNIILQKMSRNNRMYRYTLGKRYQAKENVRSLKLLQNLTLTLFTALMTSYLLIVIANLSSPTYKKIILELAEIVFNINPIYTFTTLILIVPTWKKKILQLIPQSLIYRFSSSSSVRPLEYQVKTNTETAAHWINLSEFWRS